MNTLVMTKIADGHQVNVFKERQKTDAIRFTLRNKEHLIFMIENIEVPKNLTAKGLLDFAKAAGKNTNLDITLRSDLI